MRLQPLIFQDDLARISTSVNAAQEGNLKVAEITNLKQLEINVEKSSYVLIGNAKVVNDMRNQMKMTPLTLNNKVIKERQSEKYLGDNIHSNDIIESIKMTVNER